MRFSDAQLDDIRARTDLVRLAGQLGAHLRKSGARMAGSCPLCGGGKNAKRFEVKEKESAWVCAVCGDGGDCFSLLMKVTGCGFSAAVERLGGARVLSPEEEQKLAAQRKRQEARRAAESERYRQREISACRGMWNRALPPSSIVPQYLAARGLALPESAQIREVANAPYYHGEEVDEQGRKSPCRIHQGPAMLAAVIGNDGAFVGLHTTWLAPDVRAKAQIVAPGTGELLVAKKMRGSKSGGHIVLRQADASPRRLFLGEGIETVLSVALALRKARRFDADDAFWSSCDLGNLGGPHDGTVPHPVLKTPNGRAQNVPGPKPDFSKPGIIVPESVCELVLLGDGDSERVLTLNTLERARARHAREGLRTAIVMAPDGMDFNDMLKGMV